MEVRFGKFVLVDLIAEGGMGEVFLARQRGIADVERDVVLKRMRPALRDEEAFERLFISEARISARLTHPNVVQLYEFGRIEESYFLTFERVLGLDVRQLCKRVGNKPWPVDVVLELALQLLSGLSHVHRLEDFDGRPLHIVHRDVSPGNLMISYEGTAKLLDFGVARSALSPEEQSNAIHGKFPYLSPEQCELKPLDERSDLFSLGTVLYELLTGERPFAREVDTESLGAVLFYEPPVPSSVASHLPPSIDAILGKAMAKPREERFPTADAMAAEIEKLAHSLAVERGPRLLARFVASLASDQPAKLSHPEVAPQTTLTQPNMLLVDDDDENLQALRRTFRNKYTLFTTTDPREALRILEDNVIHIIVTDQRMPHLTGIELLERASQMHHDVLKVITSALSDGPTLLDAINRGHIHRYVVKPWSPEDLRRTVAGLVAERGLGGSERVMKQLEREASQLSQLSGAVTEDTIEIRGRARRLRPELLRIVGRHPRVGLLLAWLETPDENAARRLTRALMQVLRPHEPAIEVSDERVAAILIDDGEPAPLAGRIAQAMAKMHDALAGGGGTSATITSTIIPDEASDVDDALMRVATAAVHQRKRTRTP